MSQEVNIILGPKPLYPVESCTIGQKMYKALLEHSHIAEALVDAHSEEKLSFKTILEITCRLAQSLKNCGFRQNDTISVCSENNLYFLCPVIAAFYLGVVTAPLNENYSKRELHSVLNISKPQLIFCSKKSLPKILELQRRFSFIQKIIILDWNENIQGVESLQHFIRHNTDSNFSINNFSPSIFDASDQVALIMCSSGTTGLPKGVMLTHKNLMVRIAHISDPFSATERTPGAAVLNCLPYFHAFGLLTTIGYLILGLKTILMRGFEPELFLGSIQKYKVRSMYIAPPILVFVAKSSIVEKYDVSSLREIISGAAPLAKELEEAVSKRLNIYGIRQGYGLTESTLAVLLLPANISKKGSTGKVLPYISAKVINPDTQMALGPNQIGELCLKSDMTMKGYAGDIDATRAAIDTDGWLHTGDVAYYDEEEYFYIVDRLKELIKYKGYQVPPAELEALLLEHSGIRDAAVVGLPDEEAGELPLAFVALQPGKQLTEKEVTDFVASQVSPPKRLRGGVRFVNEIPKSATGKILRRHLREIVKKQKSKL